MSAHEPVLHTEDLPAEAERGDVCFVVEPMPSFPMPGELYMYQGGRWMQVAELPRRCPTCGQVAP